MRSTEPGETETVPSHSVLPVSLRPKRIRKPASAANADDVIETGSA